MAEQLEGSPFFDWLTGATQREAMRQHRSGISDFENIQVPTQFDRQGPTEFGNIQTDPRYRQAQNQALAQMQDIAAAKGNDAAYRAQMNAAQQQMAQQERGQREALAGQARQRGTYGQGQHFAQQLAAQQGGAQAASNQGFNAAAEAQNRYLNAVQQGGQMGLQMQGQQYGEQADKARAQDQINQFNTQGANANRFNQFNAQMGRAQGMAGARRGYAGALQGQNQQVSQDIGNAVNTAGRFMGLGGF